MFSILIPARNYDCAKFVRKLAELADKLTEQTHREFQYEILVSDDCSDSSFRHLLQTELSGLAHCRCFFHSRPLGPAKSRNFLMEKARFPLLLFADCDMKIEDENFLLNYWNSRKKADVVVGSLRAPAKNPFREGHELRYKYEQHAKKYRTLAFRRKHPHLYFTCANVLISAKAAREVKFDERCEQYGFEDTLFGIMLRKKNYTFLHIENYLIHCGIDSNESFLRKTEQAMETLRRLDKSLQRQALPSRISDACRKLRIDGLLSFIFRMTKNSMRRQLLSRTPLLPVFQLYKTLFYINLCRAENHKRKMPDASTE